MLAPASFQRVTLVQVDLRYTDALSGKVFERMSE